jgi:putative flippase GtrA
VASPEETPDRPSRSRRYGGYALALALGTAAPVFGFDIVWFADLPIWGHFASSLAIGIFALTFPWLLPRIGVPLSPSFVRLLAAFGLILGVFSILTGIQNGLTDEPYTTPRYVTLLWAGENPYAHPLVFDYTQYGVAYHSVSYYVYLPLLQFVFLPGIDYRWVAFACWFALFWAVRRDPIAAVLVAQPYVVLIAASGYNDLPTLLLLTWGFIGLGGRPRKWAEWLGLGMKQFANVVVLAYYVARKDLRNALVTIGVTAAFLVPFLLWSPESTACNAVLYGLPSWCYDLADHNVAGWNWNYSLYPLWVVVAFHAPMLARGRQWWATLEAFLATSPRLRRFSGGFLRYAVVGASGVLVNLAAFTGAAALTGMAPPWVFMASGTAFGVALAWNFTWNFRWTFAGRRSRPLVVHLGLYAILQLVSLGVSLAVLAAVIALGGSALIGQLAGVLASSVWGFAANARWNFTAGGEPARGGQDP